MAPFQCTAIRYRPHKVFTLYRHSLLRHGQHVLQPALRQPSWRMVCDHGPTIIHL